MGFSLSVNTNPLVNRFAEPEDLIGTLAEEVGIGHIQLVHEFVNPSWPAATVKRLTDRLARACAARRAHITSIMTGPYGRLNHFAHPDRRCARLLSALVQGHGGYCRRPRRAGHRHPVRHLHLSRL